MLPAIQSILCNYTGDACDTPDSLQECPEMRTFHVLIGSQQLHKVKAGLVHTCTCVAAHRESRGKLHRYKQPCHSNLPRRQVAARCGDCACWVIQPQTLQVSSYSFQGSHQRMPRYVRSEAPSALEVTSSARAIAVLSYGCWCLAYRPSCCRTGLK